MRYALIGCGRISTNHIKAAVNNKLEIVAVCDIIPEHMEAVLDKHGLKDDATIKRYTDYKKLVDELKPELVPIVFGIDGVVMVEKAAVAVRIFATSMIIMTINVVIGYYLQSTEQNLMASVIVSLRCFALFLAATFGLGILFGLNGVWAAYTVSEILTLFIIVCMVKYKQKKLMKSGINSNFMLLDDTVEKGAVSYICNLKKDNYDDYLLAVEKAVQESNMDENSIRTAIDYLCELKSSAEQDKAKYIEVEINSTINKIIIRDNLKHATEFDTVLGWNRICIG